MDPAVELERGRVQDERRLVNRLVFFSCNLKSLLLAFDVWLLYIGQLLKARGAERGGDTLDAKEKC